MVPVSILNKNVKTFNEKPSDAAGKHINNSNEFVQLLVEDSDESEDERQNIFNNIVVKPYEFSIDSKLKYDLNLDSQALLNNQSPCTKEIMGGENINMKSEDLNTINNAICTDNTYYQTHITKQELVIVDDYTEGYAESGVEPKNLYREEEFNIPEYQNKYMISSLDKISMIDSNKEMELGYTPDTSTENSYSSILRDHDYYFSEKEDTIKDVKNFILTNSETSDNPIELAMKFTNFVLDKYDIRSTSIIKPEEMIDTINKIDEKSKSIKDYLESSAKKTDNNDVIVADPILEIISVVGSSQETVTSSLNLVDVNESEPNSRIEALNNFAKLFISKSKVLTNECKSLENSDDVIDNFITEMKTKLNKLIIKSPNFEDQTTQTDITQTKMESLMNAKLKDNLLNSISSESSSDDTEFDEDVSIVNRKKKSDKKNNNLEQTDSNDIESRVLGLSTDEDDIRLFVSDDESQDKSTTTKSDLVTTGENMIIPDINDEKLNMNTQVVVQQMTESDIEKYNDDLRDKEIEKLLDFTSLEAVRYTSEISERGNIKTNKKTKLSSNVLEDILKDAVLFNSSDESGDEADTQVVTEHQYLIKSNDNMKQRLLQNLESSSDSGDSVLSLVDLDAERNSPNDDDSNSNESIMSQYLNDLMEENSDSKEENTNKVDNESRQNSRKNSTDSNEKMPLFGDISEFLENELIESEKVLELKDLEKKNDIGLTDDQIMHKTTIKNNIPSRDTIDTQIFSKKLEKEMKNNENTESNKDHDSDVELVDCTMFKKVNEKDLSNNQKNKLESTNNTDDFDLTGLFKKTDTRTKRNTDDVYISLSSDSDSDTDKASGTNENDESEAKKRGIRAMLSNDELAEETIRAQKEEQDRIKRVKEKKVQLAQIINERKEMEAKDPTLANEIILDYDSKKKIKISIHPDIVRLLKPHQIDGVKFMYESCYGSVDFIKYPASGCILAHCMGLGKTLQLITLLHTVIRYPQLRTKRVLVLCPKSTVINWSDEFQRWLSPIKIGPKCKVFFFPDNSDVNDKLKILKDWFSSTSTRVGCLLIGYEAFRALVAIHKRKNNIALNIDAVSREIDEYLLEPGADLVICDEGHVIKNRKSATNCAVSKIKTRRRIILTGTPIQNNLNEYYCMVNFIKPSFLGTEKEFANLYANPIKNGQHKDSDSRAIKVMKQRSYVLHNKLSKFVQRKEAAILKEFLPEKYEYVIFVPLTDVQEKLYNLFLENNALRDNHNGKSLIPDYTLLRKIWTHPKVLENAWENALKDKDRKVQRMRRLMMNVDDDDVPDDVLDRQDGNMSVTTNWWRNIIAQEDLESIIPSNKIKVMFEILKLCKERGEKCLIFSAFVAVLNIVEHFMAKINNQDFDPNSEKYGFNQFKGPWIMGQDYYRLDGKTSKSLRHTMISKFNDPQNKRVKCFLISAKAGGQGINLIGANRVIILDTSWNPSNDQQNIFRVFRLGQKRKCFVYRLIAMGSMEEKVYSRSVTKQAMSFRVVDEQQIDRHYSMAELSELYTLTKTDFTTRPTPMLPADDILAHLLKNFPHQVYKYHEHDSLLENKLEQELSEQDKKEAWDNYELAEKSALHNQQFPMLDGFGIDAGFGMKYPQSNLPYSFVDARAYLNSYGMQPNMFNNNYLNSPYAGLDPSLVMMNNLYNRYSNNPATQPSTSTNFPSPNTNSNFTNSSFLSQLTGNSLMNMFPQTPLPGNYLSSNPISNTLNSLGSMASSMLPESPLPAHQSSLARPPSNPMDNSSQYFELLQLKNYMSGGSMLSLSNSPTLQQQHHHHQQQQQSAFPPMTTTIPTATTTATSVSGSSTSTPMPNVSSLMNTANQALQANINNAINNKMNMVPRNNRTVNDNIIMNNDNRNLLNSLVDIGNKHALNKNSINNSEVSNTKAKSKAQRQTALYDNAKSIPSTTQSIYNTNNINNNKNSTALSTTTTSNNLTITAVSANQAIYNNAKQSASAVPSKTTTTATIQKLSKGVESGLQIVPISNLNMPKTTTTSGNGMKSATTTTNPVLPPNIRNEHPDLQIVSVASQNKTPNVESAVKNVISSSTPPNQNKSVTVPTSQTVKYGAQNKSMASKQQNVLAMGTNKKINSNTVQAITNTIQAKQTASTTNPTNPIQVKQIQSTNINTTSIPSTPKQTSVGMGTKQVVVNQKSNVPTQGPRIGVTLEKNVSVPKHQLVNKKPEQLPAAKAVSVTTIGSTSVKQTPIRNSNMGIVYPSNSLQMKNIINNAPTTVSAANNSKSVPGSISLPSSPAVNSMPNSVSSLPSITKVIQSNANNRIQTNSNVANTSATSRSFLQIRPVTSTSATIPSTSATNVAHVNKTNMPQNIIPKKYANQHNIITARPKHLVRTSGGAVGNATTSQQLVNTLNNLKNNTSQISVVKTSGIASNVSGTSNVINSIQQKPNLQQTQQQLQQQQQQQQRQQQQKQQKLPITASALSRKRKASDMINDLITTNKTLTVSTLTNAPPIKKPYIVPTSTVVQGQAQSQQNMKRHTLPSTMSIKKVQQTLPQQQHQQLVLKKVGSSGATTINRKSNNLSTTNTPQIMEIVEIE